MPGWNGSVWFSILWSDALRSAAVLGAAWVVTLLMRKRSAAARHLVWTGAASAVLALPFLALSLPAVPAGARLPLGADVVIRADVPSPFPAFAAAPAPSGGASWPAATTAWRPDSARWLAIAWGAGTAFLLARLAMAWLGMTRLRRRALPVAGAEAGDIPVMESGALAMPLTFGFLRPAILLPAGAREWSGPRRRMVLLHEGAHVRRGDAATQLIARVACAFYWWNPLVWVAWREFLKERERAADDAVLAAGARASDYAALLLELASMPQTSGAAGVAMARRSQLEGRLVAILDSGLNRGAAGRRAPWIASLAAIALVAPFGAVRAQAPAQISVPADIDATVRAATAGRDPAMLDRTADACEAHHDYAASRRLREAALPLHGQISGETSREYQAELVSLGSLAERTTQGDKRAEEYYRQAAALADRPESAPALVFLGLQAYGAARDADAVALFERVLNASPEGIGRGRALTWMAMVRQREGKAAEAESLYRRALELEGDSAAATTTRELYVRLLREQGRASETQPLAEQASAWRRQHISDLSPKRSAGALPVLHMSGGGVTAPVLVSRVEPSYSQEGRAAKLQETVVLEVVLEPDGTTSDVRLLKSAGLGLDEMALDAVCRWRFKPGTKETQPVPIAATIEISFRLM